MNQRPRVLVIGTGFLGQWVVVLLSSVADVTMTHHKHKRFDDSIQFDFLRDKPQNIFGAMQFDRIIITAKIEMNTDSIILSDAMKDFLAFFHGTHILYVSSDGIFDGWKGMYTEDMLPMPSTPYGLNLQICETAVQKMCSEFCIVRPSYLFGLGCDGELDPRLAFAKTMMKRGIAFDRYGDMYKSPMNVKQVASIIADLSLDRYVGIMHVSGERMSVYDFFKKELQLLGVSVETLYPIPMLKKKDSSPDTSLEHKDV